MRSSLILKFTLGIVIFPSTFLLAQSGGINTNGAMPVTNAMLDNSSTTNGLLIPSMTTFQRDMINTPPNRFQADGMTTNILDISSNSALPSVDNTNTSNLTYVYSLADLPAPVGSAILLDAAKMYIFSGIVDISPNYLDLNGAGLRGTDPGKDGVMSTVNGGILRSTGVSVFIEDLAVLPASESTKAYDFADATGAQFCNIFSGCSVEEIGIPSLGVGQISGFRAITVEKNHWNCVDGIKIAGNVGKFVSLLNYITGITAGRCIEFMVGLTINDIDLSNNYFILTGQTGVKVNIGDSISNGRMTNYMYRDVGTVISGFDSYTSGSEMLQDTGIPNTQSLGYAHVDGNLTNTTFTAVGVCTKIMDTTTLVKEKEFSASNNRFTYIGKRNIDSKVFVVIGAKTSPNAADYTIAIAKNGAVISAPTSSLGPLSMNEGFQIVFESSVSFSTNDFIEVFIKSNSGPSALAVKDLQLKVGE